MIPLNKNALIINTLFSRVSFIIPGTIKLVIICVKRVAIAAPLIPINEIKIIFIIKLHKAPIPAKYFSYLTLPSHTSQLFRADPKKENAVYHVIILNGVIAPKYFSP